jgi:hypothetical protein
MASAGLKSQGKAAWNRTVPLFTKPGGCIRKRSCGRRRAHDAASYFGSWRGGLLLRAAPGNAFPFGDPLALFGGSTHVKVWRRSMDPTNSASWRRPCDDDNKWR